MVDVIVLIAVVVLLGFALKSAIKHFRGEGSCCGGGAGLIDDSVEKRLDGPVLGQKILHISGMNCARCARSVTRALNSIDGAAARVFLKKETALLSYDRVLDDEAIRLAVEEAGFGVVSIIDENEASCQ